MPLLTSFYCAWRESNPQRRSRSPMFYPLNYSRIYFFICFTNILFIIADKNVNFKRFLCIQIFLKMSTLNANVFSLFFTFSILHNFAFNFYAPFTFCKFRLVLDVDPDPVRLLPPVKMGARNKAALLLSLYAAILSNSSLYNCSAVLY